jgi:UDPglucose 6-dehydrogenase
MSLETGRIDLSIIHNVFDRVSQINGKRDNIFIVKSTVIPGTVESLIDKYPKLNIVFSPEFLTERNAKLDFINSSRIVLGGENNLTTRVENMFRDRFPHTPILKTDVTTSQFIKYMNNCFFATKVSFMNEMHQAASRMEVNWNDALKGFLLDGRIGNSHVDVPGHDGQLGFGGKCFPKDINAFINLFHDYGVDAKVMKAAWEKNLEIRDRHDWLDIKGAVSKKS